MRDTSELVESETFVKSKRRRVWGVVWKLMLVLVVSFGIWMYMVSLRPVAPERWRVEREPMFSGVLGDWTGGFLREPAVIRSYSTGDEVITPEVLRWLRFERPIKHMDVRRYDFTQISTEEMEVFDALTSMYLRDCKMGDEQLAGLAKATNLRTFHVINYYVRDGRTVNVQTMPTDGSLGGLVVEFSPEGMKAMWGMKQLRMLWLRSVAIGDAGVVGISRLKLLGDLDLKNCSIRGEGLKEIALLPKLSHLRLESNPLDEESLRYLVGMESLRSITLNYTPVGDGGLAYLGAMKGLSGISLNHTQVTGEGLAALVGLPKLLRLRLDHTAVGDEGLKYLVKLEALETLDLRGAQVTAAGLKGLGESASLKEINLDDEFLQKNAEAIAEFESVTGIDVKN